MPLPGRGKPKGTRVFSFFDEGEVFQNDRNAAPAARFEDRHRRDQPEEVTAKVQEPAPAQPQQPLVNRPDPPVVLPPDRLHKTNAVDYIFVAKDHYPGEDSVINPAYRSASATFSSIGDAQTFAKTLIPKLALPEQRIAIYVIGGTWAESVTFDSGRIDLIGVGGRPRIHGVTTIAVPGGILLENFELYNAHSAALVIGAIPDAGADEPSIILQNLRVRSGGNAFRSLARFHAYDCKFYSDTDINSFTVDITWNPVWQSMYAEFFRCEIYAFGAGRGSFRNYGDISSAPFVIGNLYGNFIHLAAATGGAIRVSTLRPDGSGLSPNIETQRTGTILRYTTVHGYALNEGWALGHEHCRLYGGLADPIAAGTIYCIQRSQGSTPGMPGFNIDSVTWWDDCNIRAKIIAVQTDFSGNFGAVNYSQFRHSGHGTDVDITAPNAFNALALPFAGAGFVSRVKSTTDAAIWFIGAGIDIDSSVNVPIQASYSPYYP